MIVLIDFNWIYSLYKYVMKNQVIRAQEGPKTNEKSGLPIGY